MLIDANILLYAVDAASPHHRRASAWLTERLNGDRRVGIPWESFNAFLRIATHPRAAEHPLRSAQAWAFIDGWLAVDSVWVPTPTERHADVLSTLVRAHGITGNLVPDAHLAALAIEHGLEVCSADSDFALFPEIAWLDPITGRR